MNEKMIKKFEKNVGTIVTGATVNVEKNELELVFNEKILFVNKKKSYKFSASENISTIALGCIVNSKMTKFNFDGLRLEFTFKNTKRPVYKLSFKIVKSSL